MTEEQMKRLKELLLDLSICIEGYYSSCVTEIEKQIDDLLSKIEITK